MLDPIKLVIENYPEDRVEELKAENNPEDTDAGTRSLPFSRELYIEQDDFREEAPSKWFRLAPGREVRLKHAYYVTCTDVKRDGSSGEITELVCRYDPDTMGGWSSDGRKVRGTLHWVSAAHALDAEVRLYDHLFSRENPDEAEDFTECINPDSLQVLEHAKLEPGLGSATSGEGFQFLRRGYFCVDRDSSEKKIVFNRTATLRDTWAKIEKAHGGKGT